VFSTFEIAVVDGLALLVMVVSLALGLWRGFVHEFFSLLGWMAAFFVAKRFAETVSMALPWFADSPLLRWLAAFALIFVACVLTASLLAWLLSGLLQSVGLRPADRMLGAVFGVLRGAFLVMLLSALWWVSPLAKADFWTHSHVSQISWQVMLWTKPHLPEGVAVHLP
jgi:membrane protein required for colicin V production